MKKPVNGVLVPEFEPVWDCHACGQPIDATSGIVIIDQFIYHVEHNPTVDAGDDW